MGRNLTKNPGRRSKAEKERIAVTIDQELLEWIDGRVEPGGPFGSYTHAIEFALHRLRREEEELRREVEEHGVRFDPQQMWSLFDALIHETRSRRRGPQT